MSRALSPARLATLPDEALLEAVQRQTFRYFWEGAHPVSGLALDRRREGDGAGDDRVVSGGSGFGVMCLIVAAERGWVERGAALERLRAMLDVLVKATCYHGALPHFLNGRTGATIPFTRKDDAADLVETSFLFMGLLCARQYFDRSVPAESEVRGLVDYMWREIEWAWFARSRDVLTWHWSPNNGWSMNLEIRGWNECLITYVLAAASQRYAVSPEAYHRGFAAGRDFLNGKTYHDIVLPLGPSSGGPLYFAHYSFLGLDPRGLKDRYADYWQQNVSHVRINHAYCASNPQGHQDYGANCWGLTSSEGPDGYAGHAPDYDDGTLSPTAALSSMPYAPREALAAIRYFLDRYGAKVWGDYGFVDAFNPGRDWQSDAYLAIDQAPIIVMIENYRSGLLWRLFMGVPEVRSALLALSFSSPHLQPP